MIQYEPKTIPLKSDGSVIRNGNLAYKLLVCLLAQVILIFSSHEEE